MKKHAILLSWIAVMLCWRASAQSIGAFDLYQYNYSLINPAYTGLEATHKVSATGRIENINDFYLKSSWMVGYEFSLKKLHSGVGINFTKDNFGPYKHTRSSLTYSYAFTLADSSQLRLGTNLSYDQISIDYSQYGFLNAIDLQGYDRGATVGVGVWYCRTKLFAGVAVDYLNQPRFNINLNNTLDSSGVVLHRQYKLSAGYRDLPLVNHFTVSPSINFIRLYNRYWFTDLNATVAYQKKYLLGFGYRINQSTNAFNSFRINTGVQLFDRVQLVSLIYVQKQYERQRRSLSGELLVKVTL